MISLWQQDGIGIWQSQKDSFDDDGVYGFNVGMHVGDDPTQVLQRRALLLERLSSFGVRELVWVNQIHSSDVYYYKGDRHRLVDADALITKRHGVGLCMMTADCVPIALFANPRTIGCIHAGHQGLSQGVIANTVKPLGDCPTYAYIGACISGGCYELPKTLGVDIITQCIQRGYNSDEVWEALTATSADKVLLDVGLIARDQLARLGVTVLNGDQPCSYLENYHSHRQSSHLGGVSGRMAMIIAVVA